MEYDDYMRLALAEAELAIPHGDVPVGSTPRCRPPQPNNFERSLASSVPTPASSLDHWSTHSLSQMQSWAPKS